MAAPVPPKPKRARKHRRAAPGFGDIAIGPRRVAIYLRRSTDDEHQPFSISAQDSALGKYVTTQPGWTLVATFTDDASGATTSRPGLQHALRAARAGRFDVLLVYRVDRFSRRLSDLLDLLNELEEAGVAFASATEPFDTSTSIGRMLVQLLGVFVEFERETIIDRVTKGMAMKASKGKWPGGSRPYGFYVDRETQKLMPHPQEAPRLREIFRLFAEERLGTRAIADELNQRGVSNRTGKPWSGHTINRIIANPASRADARTQRAMSGSDYHLTGLITCPACGHKFIGTAATGRNRLYRYCTCFLAAATAPTAAKPSASQPKPSIPRSCTPSRTSTPATPTSSRTQSPAPSSATATAAPNTPLCWPRSRRRRQRSTGTSPRSRTAPWPKKPLGKDSKHCAGRSPSSPSAPRN